MIYVYGTLLVAALVLSGFWAGRLWARTAEQSSRVHLDAVMYRDIFTTSPMGVAVVDFDDNWLNINESFAHLFGYTQAEILNDGPKWPELTYGIDIEDEKRELQRLLGGELDFHSYKKQYKHRTGKIVYVLLTVSLIKENGQPKWWLAQAVDMTTEEIAGEKIAKQMEELRRYNYIASHDLKEPLRAIHGYAEMISMTTKDPETKKKTARIIKSAARMQQLISDMADYDRISAGTELVTAIRTTEKVENVIDDMQYRIDELDAEIKVDVADAVIHAPPSKIRTVLHNVLSNALKFGSLADTCEISITGEKVAGGRYQFQVIDNGPGIPPGQTSRVFEPFTSLDPAVPGTGMGLAICRRGLASIGGTIAAESSEEGTIITIEV